MGYKDAYDNKNIVIDIKNKTTQAEIVKAYVPSAEQQEEINKAFSVLEKTIGQEQQEVEKATTEELKNLHQEIIAKAYEQYGNTLSGKITLKMMQDKLLSAATTLGSNDILTIDDNDHGLVFAVQVALARSKELGIVDGENRQKSE